MDNYEREVSIRDIFWYVVGKWYWLIVGLIAGVLLIAGYTAYKNSKAKPIVEEELTEEQIDAIENAVDLYETHVKLKESAENNYILKMDNEKVDTVVIQYYIESDYTMNYTGDISLDYTGSVAEAYRSYITGYDVRSNIVALGIEGVDMDNVGNLASASVGASILTVVVKSNDASTTQRIVKVIEKAIESYTEKLNEIIGAHKVVFMNKNHVVVKDGGILNAQNSIKTGITNALNNLNAALKNLNDKQKKIYERKIEGKEDSTETEVEPIVIKEKLNKKKIVVGAFIGIFGTICIIAFAFVVSSKVRNKDDVAVIVKEGFVQYISTDNMSKKRFKIKQKENQDEYIGKLIKEACDKNNAKDVCIMSSLDMTDEMKGITANISKTVSGIKFICMDNAFETSNDTLNSAIECKNVLMIEKVDKTSADSLGNVARVLKENDVTVVGTVLLV